MLNFKTAILTVRLLEAGRRMGVIALLAIIATLEESVAYCHSLSTQEHIYYLVNVLFVIVC